MLIDKTHVRWSIISAAILLAGTGSYVVYAGRAMPGPSGGSIMGLLYGIIGSLMMIFAALFAVRKRVPTWRWGSAQFWLRGHLWLGGLSFVLILFHSGFAFGGTLETVLMISFILVIVSGLFGLAMQQVVPRLLTSRVAMETFNQQIPFLCRRLQAQSDLAVAEVCGKLECEHDSISDAAYNLADSLDKLRNGYEGDDFQKFLDSIYVNGAATEPDSASPAGRSASAGEASSSPEQPKPAMSKLEMARAAAAAKKKGAQAEEPDSASAGDAAGSSPQPKPAMSKLEMARAAAKKKKEQGGNGSDSASAGEAPSAAEQPKPAMSKLEMARAAAKKKKEAQAIEPDSASPADSSGSPEKPKPAMSKLEMARAAAQKKKAGAPGLRESGSIGRSVSAGSVERNAESGTVAGNAESGSVAVRAAAPAARVVNPIVSVPCPKCSKELVLPDRSFLGRFGRCPQCTHKFVLRLPPAPQREPAPIEEFPPPPEPPAPSEPAKPLSKIEQARAAAAKRKAEQGDGEAKPLSKLEMARAAAKRTSGEEQSAAPKSKLELARAAARKTPKEKPASGAAAAKKPAPTKAAKSGAKASAASEPIPRTDILKRFYLTEVRPVLAFDRGRKVSGRSGFAPQLFGQMRNKLPAQLHPTLNQLEAHCEERRQFALQQRLHWLLHSWLLVHIPATIGLLVLFVVHVVMALRVIPWPL